MVTPLDEFMAKKANEYMAVVDTWRPQTRQFKETYDEYKRWVGAPNGTEWTGRTSNAAYDTASTDCHGSDNTDDAAEDGGKLVAATIQYEVVEPLVNGQRLIESVLAHKDQGVSIDQNYNMAYHPAEGESDESIARNREHVADIERQVKGYVAQWDKGCQTLKAQADAIAQKITGCINPKTALVDGRKILRDAVHPTPGEGSSTATAASGKPHGIVEGIQDIAGAGDTKPASTAAVADYKEWYPKTPSAGDKLTMDPSKAGSLTGTIGALDKMPGAPKPQDGFGSGVAKQFLKGANDRIDGTIDEVKSKAGLNGADKFAESWTNSAKGLEHQVERTLFPGAAMAEDAKNVIDQAVTSYQHPEKIPENIGKTTVDGAIIGGTAPLGGEGALGRLGVEEGAAARGAIPDSAGMLHDLPGGHLFDGPPHPHADAPSGGHSSGEIGPVTGEHSGTIGDHGGASHAPDLNHVSTESGGPGGWNQELNKPAPNTHYNVDDRFQYTTDEQRRVGHAEMTYDNGAEPGDRNGHQQRIAGGPDRLPGDQGGHIFGTQFGGPGEAINITAMRDTLNQVGARDYYNLEAQWRQLAEQGGQVQVKVDIAYPGDSLRPESYTVETYVDGKLNSTYHFDN